MQLAPFKLERYFARYEFTARYTLCSSDCESLAVQDLLGLEPDAPDLFQRHWLGYTQPSGAPTLREEISRVYATIGSEQVLVHSGAEEAIFLFMHAALRSGDHVIVQAPCYQSLAEVARSIGCEVTPWLAVEGRGWALDLKELVHLIRTNTKVVVINTPHNPTGSLMSKEDFRELNRITEEKGIVLFSDEVYRESELDPQDRLPAACDINELAISLGVMSKTYGLPGLRIGWIATHNADMYAIMARLKDYTTICNSAPSEFLAELALRHRPWLVARNVGIMRENLSLLDDLFYRHQEVFSWKRPRAGPVAFPRLVDEDSDAFCHELVTRTGVLLLPGSVYDDDRDHFRIGFGRRNMPEALTHFEGFLKAR